MDRISKRILAYADKWAKKNQSKSRRESSPKRIDSAMVDEGRQAELFIQGLKDGDRVEFQFKKGKTKTLTVKGGFELESRSGFRANFKDGSYTVFRKDGQNNPEWHLKSGGKKRKVKWARVLA